MKILPPLTLLLSLVCFLGTNQVYAWNAPGHMVTAIIAYRHLKPQTRSQVDAILVNHPDYTEWVKAYEVNDSLTREAYVFARASVWPDVIRAQKNHPYDHFNWHFVDYPYTPRKPAGKLISPLPQDDILFAFETCHHKLRDPQTSPAEQAVYLSWLLHICGDIHQPLHCLTMVNANYPPPNGDLGGNTFFVRIKQEEPTNLHRIWDGAVEPSNQTISPERLKNLADTIEKQFPPARTKTARAVTDPRAWSAESYQLGVARAYRNGKLKGSHLKEQAPPLPVNYRAAIRKTATRRAALAGYRMAGKLESWLPVAAASSPSIK
ncbi:MAG: S1/P1 nuclease [Blastocatellia bacterium]|nr:S1/P1 nuclease [Blastocatellia bacterium]